MPFRRLALATLVAPLLACITPPAPPTPRDVHVARTPDRVVRDAALTLFANGFTLSAAREVEGTVVATLRSGDPGADSAIFACEGVPGSSLYRAARPVLRLQLDARADGGGSAVRIATDVRTDHEGISPAALAMLQDKGSDCASTGAVERALIALLSGPAAWPSRVAWPAGTARAALPSSPAASAAGSAAARER